jgi:hypothetical protein
MPQHSLRIIISFQVFPLIRPLMAFTVIWFILEYQKNDTGGGTPSAKEYYMQYCSAAGRIIVSVFPAVFSNYQAPFSNSLPKVSFPLPWHCYPG